MQALVAGLARLVWLAHSGYSRDSWVGGGRGDGCSDSLWGRGCVAFLVLSGARFHLAVMVGPSCLCESRRGYTAGWLQGFVPRCSVVHVGSGGVCWCEPGRKEVV